MNKPHDTTATSPAKPDESQRNPAASPSPKGRSATPDLPSDPQDFWRPTMSFHDMPLPNTEPIAPAIQRLGQPPFPRSGFPLVGFLATLYQHTSAYANETLKPVSEDEEPPASS